MPQGALVVAPATTPEMNASNQSADASPNQTTGTCFARATGPTYTLEMTIPMLLFATIVVPELKWDVHDGANKATVLGGTIQVNQVGEKRTSDPAYASAELSGLQASWSVSFQVSFPKLGEHGGRVSLEAGKELSLIHI